MRFLIVNGDDFNLTEGISRSVFSAFDRGILSSTSVMINLPLSRWQIRGIQSRHLLGAGLHLNVTLGRSLLAPARVKTLLHSDGLFYRRNVRTLKQICLDELRREYECQIRCFEIIFEKKPDHLNTHHQLHADPRIFSVLNVLGRKYKIPIRRSISLTGRSKVRQAVTTDYFLGSFLPAGHWTKKQLMTILHCLPEGTSEVMCHPGISDKALKQISSLTVEREKEFRLFSDPFFRRLLKRENIRLINYRDFYFSEFGV